MTDYISKSSEKPKHFIIREGIEKIAGKVPIRIESENGVIVAVSIDDKKLSASKKKELQTYIDTLKD